MVHKCMGEVQRGIYKAFQGGDGRVLLVPKSEMEMRMSRQGPESAGLLCGEAENNIRDLKEGKKCGDSGWRYLNTVLKRSCGRGDRKLLTFESGTVTNKKVFGKVQLGSYNLGDLEKKDIHRWGKSRFTVV